MANDSIDSGVCVRISSRVEAGARFHTCTVNIFRSQARPPASFSSDTVCCHPTSKIPTAIGRRLMVTVSDWLGSVVSLQIDATNAANAR